jgi:hypothetical protein
MSFRKMVIGFTGSGRKRLVYVQTVRFICRVRIRDTVRPLQRPSTAKGRNMVLGRKLAWASKDKRFWMGLYLGFTIGGGLYLGTFGFKLLGL